MGYIQIDKGHCAGDRKLFEKIAKALKETDKFEVTEDTMIFTIKEKSEGEIVKEEQGIEEKVEDDSLIKEEINDGPGTSNSKDSTEVGKDKGTTAG